MRQHIARIHKQIEALMEKKGLKENDRKVIIEQLDFINKERLVHLLVTLFFGLYTLLSFFFYYVTEEPMVLILGILLTTLLIPYILHYYILENGIQKSYELLLELETRNE